MLKLCTSSCYYYYYSLPVYHIVPWQKPSWRERPAAHSQYSPAEAGRDTPPPHWSPCKWILGGSTGQSSLKVHTHTHTHSAHKYDNCYSALMVRYKVNHQTCVMLSTYSPRCLCGTHTGQCSTDLPHEPCSPAGPGPPVETYLNRPSTATKKINKRIMEACYVPFFLSCKHSPPQSTTCQLCFSACCSLFTARHRYFVFLQRLFLVTEAWLMFSVVGFEQPKEHV